MRKRIGVSALVLLLIVTLFAGCNTAVERPDPARGLEVVMEALMTRDKSAMEAYYPGADLSELNIDETYEKEIDQLVNDPSLGFKLTDEQTQKLKNIVYSVFERMEYKAELKEQNGNKATVLLKVQSVNMAKVFEDVPDSLVEEVTRQATEQKIDLTDEDALIALSADVMLNYWVDAVKSAELTESVEEEIALQWADGCWVPDEDALIALITKALGN